MTRMSIQTVTHTDLSEGINAQWVRSTFIGTEHTDLPVYIINKDRNQQDWNRFCYKMGTVDFTISHFTMAIWKNII